MMNMRATSFRFSAVRIRLDVRNISRSHELGIEVVYPIPIEMVVFKEIDSFFAIKVFKPVWPVYSLITICQSFDKLIR